MVVGGFRTYEIHCFEETYKGGTPTNINVTDWMSTYNNVTVLPTYNVTDWIPIYNITDTYIGHQSPPPFTK